MGNIKNFTELNAWKEGHKLVLMVYKTTSSYPSKEKFALVNQMLRSAVSITSNIAEGFGRRGAKEKIQFYYMSQASLTELQNQIIISKDVKYINQSQYEKFTDQIIIVQKLLAGLISSIKRNNP